MNPYIEILRPGNAVMGAITIILIALIDRSISIPLVLAMLAVFFETAAGNVINDYFDYNIDLVNKPERPIPSGRISLKAGRNYAYLFPDKQLDTFPHSYHCRHYPLSVCL